MNSCPKCGCCVISGPVYRMDYFGGEELRYRCTRCGYEQSTETLDRQREKEKRKHGPDAIAKEKP